MVRGLKELFEKVGPLLSHGLPSKPQKSLGMRTLEAYVFSLAIRPQKVMVGGHPSPHRWLPDAQTNRSAHTYESF
jgi:hypothetical protein